MGRGGARGRAGAGANSLLAPRRPRAPLSPRLSSPPHHSATILWRKEFKPETITWADVADLNTGRLELLDQRDNAGRPINFFRLRCAFFWGGGGGWEWGGRLEQGTSAPHMGFRSDTPRWVPNLFWNPTRLEKWGREGGWRGRRGEGEEGRGETTGRRARGGKRPPHDPPAAPSLTHPLPLSPSPPSSLPLAPFLSPPRPLPLSPSPPSSCPFNEGASAATVLRQWIYHIEAVVQHADEGAAAGLAATGKVVLVFDMKTFPDTKEPPLAAQIECLRLAQVRHVCVWREGWEGMGAALFYPAWLASLRAGGPAPAVEGPPRLLLTPPLSPLFSLSPPPPLTHTHPRPTTPSAWAWPSSATRPPSSGCSGAPCNPSWTR